MRCLLSAGLRASMKQAANCSKGESVKSNGTGFGFSFLRDTLLPFKISCIWLVQTLVWCSSRQDGVLNRELCSNGKASITLWMTNSLWWPSCPGAQDKNVTFDLHMVDNFVYIVITALLHYTFSITGMAILTALGRNSNSFTLRQVRTSNTHYIFWPSHGVASLADASFYGCVATQWFPLYYSINCFDTIKKCKPPNISAVPGLACNLFTLHTPPLSV